MFLVGANDWNTRLSVSSTARWEFWLEAGAAEGQYKLANKNVSKNNATKYTFVENVDNGNIYTDLGNQNPPRHDKWTFTEAGENTYYIGSEYIAGASMKVIDAEGRVSLIAESTDTWAFVNVTEEATVAKYAADLSNYKIITDYQAKAEQNGVLSQFNAEISDIIAAYEDGTLTENVSSKVTMAYGKVYNIGFIAGKQPGDDVTELLINPTFNGNINGWTDGFTSQTAQNHGYQGASYTNGDVTIGGFMECWKPQPGPLGDGKLSQTVYLPAGLYSVSASVIANQQSGNVAKEDLKGVYVFAQSGALFKSPDCATGNGAPEVFSFEFNTTGGPTEIGLMTQNTNCNWVAFDNVTLTYLGEMTINPYQEALKEVVENAKNYDAENCNASLLEAFNNAMGDAEGYSMNDQLTEEEYDKCVSDINEAEAALLASIEYYKQIKAALEQVVPDAEDFANSVANYSTEYNNKTISNEAAEDIIAKINEIANNAWMATYATIEPGEYLLQNVETGKFLGAANSWGTQASLLDRGILWNIAAAANGKYTLDSHISNGGDSHFLSGTFVDSPATAFAFTAAGEGYVLSADNVNYLTSPDNNIVDLSTTAKAGKAIWKLISKEDLYAQMTEATEANPVDATVLVKDANFDRNNQGYSAWEWTWGENNNNENHTNGGANENFVVESFHAQFKVAQTVKVPNGKYLVTAQGFYRNDTPEGEEFTVPVFFANDATAPIAEKLGDEDNMADASNAFAAGNYSIENMEVTVTDGQLTIGVDGMGSDKLWVIFDNFEITCLGMVEDEIDMVVPETGYATFVAPFAVESLPATTTAYTVDAVKGEYVILTELSTIPANTPVLLQGTCKEIVKGFSFAEPAQAGLLTGVYEMTMAPQGSYILQTQAGTTAFRKVANDGEIRVGANKCYLTAPAAEVQSLFIDAETAIKAIDNLQAGKAIYDLNGRQIQKLQKGINIVGGVKVLVK